MPSSSLPAYYDKLQLQHPRPLVDATAFLKVVVREAKKRSVSPQEFLRKRWFLSGPEVYFSRAYLQKNHCCVQRKAAPFSPTPVPRRRRDRRALFEDESDEEEQEQPSKAKVFASKSGHRRPGPGSGRGPEGAAPRGGHRSAAGEAPAAAEISQQLADIASTLQELLQGQEQLQGQIQELQPQSEEEEGEFSPGSTQSEDGESPGGSRKRAKPGDEGTTGA